MNDLKQTAVGVDTDKGVFLIEIAYHSNWMAKGAPAARWNRKLSRWVVPFTRAAGLYMLGTFNEVYFSNAAFREAHRLAEPPVFDEKFPKGYAFREGAEPMGHQTRVLDKSWEPEHFAYFHDMGTGKTFTVINMASARYSDNKIDALLVVCPTSVKSTWVEQLDEWAAVKIDVFVVNAGPKKKLNDWIENDERGTPENDEAMPVMVVGVEALSAGTAFQYALRFAKKHRTMVVCDESSRIKTPGKNRTENAIKLSDEATYRALMTGTQITQGIQDLYTQFRFLDWRIVGQKSFTGFRNRYCVMGGFENRKIVGYNNVKELMALVAPYTDVVKKKDVMDLPPATWTHRDIQPSPEQKRLAVELKQNLKARSDDDELTVRTVLERLMRYQQIAGGFFPYDDEETGNWKIKQLANNPKLTELLAIAEETDQKMIIWANFVPEVETIADALEEKYPGTVQTFYGKTDDKAAAITRFRTDDNCRFFVSRQAMGGIGLNLVEATLMVYYSNTFSYEDRKQSQDRMYRKGQTLPVTYIDLWLDVPIDKLIRKAIGMKTDMAGLVDQALIREMV